MRNLKRALSLALASVMVMSMMVIGAGAVSVDDFSDGADIVNKEDVTVLASLNVIKGKDNGSYDPTGIVTRAEMAKMICVVLNGGRDPQLGSVVADSYTDTVNHWAKAYIEYCTNLGIVAGRGDGTFAPNDTVTMAEAAKMLLVAIGYNAGIEGYVGFNWQINTDVKANQEDLYEGITATNTSVDLTRDNAAQMVYNALECQMVKYEYVVSTDGSVVTTKPQVTTEGLGNVLQEKFGASKVEAVVVSNEVAALNNSYASADDEGETTLDVIAIDGVKTTSGSGTYKVSTGKELLGQNVVVYIKYKNTVGYDESTAIVIGTPIPTSQNKVVVSTDGTKVDDVADDNKLELTDDTKYYVNFGGYYGGVVYGGDPAETGVATGDKDNKVKDMTEAEFDLAADCTGVTVTLIDNNSDKKVDYALAEKYSHGVVNKYTTGDDAAIRIQGLFNEDEYEAEKVVGFDDVALNDLVLFTEYGGKVYVQKPETQEAVLNAYSTSKKNMKLDDETIKWSGLEGFFDGDVRWIGEYLTESGVLNVSAVFYKDNNGYVFGVSETDESLLTYAVLLGYENQTRPGSGLGTTARAKLLLADGSRTTYDVLSINGNAVTDCTNTNTASGSQVGFNGTDLGKVYSYTINDNKQVRLVERFAAKFDHTVTASTLDYNKGESALAFTNAKNPGTSDGITVATNGNYTVTDRTTFLYVKTDGSIARYQGRTAPSIKNTAGSAALTLSTGETATIYANRRGEALVVFLNNVDPTSEFKDNWAFVYKTKVTESGDNFEVDAIIDGKLDTYLVDGATNSSGVSVITPDGSVGSWGHVMPTGIYNYAVNDGIYTLKLVADVETVSYGAQGSNVMFGLVNSFRGDNYVRVNGVSYTLTDKTVMYDARTNKTAFAITSVNTGDEALVVFNSDNEAVYVFLTEYSYNIMDAAYAPSIDAGSSNTSTKNFDTDGGLVGTIELDSFTHNNLKHQWYKSTDNSATTKKDDVALVDSMGYTGAETKSLSVNKGTLKAGTYYFYCVVSNTDKNGVTGTDTSAVVTVTVSNAPVAGSLRVIMNGLTSPAVVVNNTPVTLTTVGADKWATGISKGDTVEIIATEFAMGTYWTVDGIDDPVEVTTANVLKFTMPNGNVNIDSTDKRFAVTVDGNDPIYVTSGTTVDSAWFAANGITLTGKYTKVDSTYKANASVNESITANTIIESGYYAVTENVTVSGSPVGLASVTATAKVSTPAANTGKCYIKADGTGKASVEVTVTPGGSGAVTADINAKLSADNGAVVGGDYASDKVLIADGTTPGTTPIKVTATIEVAAISNDVTLTLTLTLS